MHSDTVPTLLFVPDISGFTRFVTDTEISHSQHIIQELLEAIIDANQIDLEVSEIEGDAVLFYRHGASPTAQQLLDQVEKMYIQFHAHLKVYESKRICQCGACSTANELKLKFFVHYGDIGLNQVKEHKKLFGREVIVVHRLMKNDVPIEEYLLFTHDLASSMDDAQQINEIGWSAPIAGNGEYDFGTIDYCYLALNNLHSRVPEPELEDFSLQGPVRRLTGATIDINAPLDLVFDVLSDLAIRHEWLAGLKDSDQLNSRITQNGSTHRCVINENERDPFLVTHSFRVQPDLVAFTDTDQRFGLETVYTLQSIDSDSTRLEMVHFLKRNVFKEFIVGLFFLRKLKRLLLESMDNLKTKCEYMCASGEVHTSQIILFPDSEIKNNTASGEAKIATT